MTEEAIHKWVQHHLRIDQIRFLFNIRYYGTNKVMASITKHDKAQDAQADEKVFRLEDFPVHEKLEKFMEDVKWVASEVYDFLLSQSLWFCDWYLFSGMASTLWLHSPWQCHHPQKLSPQLRSCIGILWHKSWSARCDLLIITSCVPAGAILKKQMSPNLKTRNRDA